jgi:hypothetical protein
MVWRPPVCNTLHTVYSICLILVGSLVFSMEDIEGFFRKHAGGTRARRNMKRPRQKVTRPARWRTHSHIVVFFFSYSSSLTYGL